MLGRAPLDRLGAAPASSNLNSARLCPLRDRDRDRQNTILVVGFDRVRVETLTEKHLPREASLRAFGDDHLVLLLALVAPLRGDRQDVSIDAQVDRVRIDARQIKVDEELLAAPI